MSDRVIVSIATAWGPRFGGINSFNADLLKGLGTACRPDTRIISLVSREFEGDRADAQQARVELRAFATPPAVEHIDENHAAEVVRLLEDVPLKGALWIGHDLFTGGAAVAAARQSGGFSAVIHHMSYAAYEGFKSGSSEKAAAKMQTQRRMFGAADHRLAVGPLLQGALVDLVGDQNVKMLVPGLAEITAMPNPRRFTVIQFGRLNPETDAIKQGKLGVAAFARAYGRAIGDKLAPELLRDRPRLRLFGIGDGEEAEIRAFASREASAALDLHALPYDSDREKVFTELAGSSVAMMPSWHEGFGLVGWEAIAAQVPLIVGRQSGLWKLLQEIDAGLLSSGVLDVEIRGRDEEGEPYQESDIEAIADRLREVALSPDRTKRRAQGLRERLSRFTWSECARSMCQSVGWSDVCITDAAPESRPAAAVEPAQLPVPAVDQLISIPRPAWRPGQGHADSLLLCAEESSVPFYGREDLLKTLLQWIDGPDGFPLEVRLHTGAGGIGKTRLMMEVCKRLGDTWLAGFLRSAATPGDIRRQLPIQVSAHKKVLIVIDYAETQRENVAAVVGAAMDRSDRRARIVLLARDGGEWWDRLAADFPKCERILGGRATSGPYPIAPLHTDPSHRPEAFRAAWRAFTTRLELDRAEPEVVPNLDAEHFGSALYVQMAALLAVRGERADSPTALTDALLRREIRYWSRLASSLNMHDLGRCAEHLLLIATLTGGIASQREAAQLYKASGGPDISKGKIEALFRGLITLYPGQRQLTPLRPDILGESLVARGLKLSTDDSPLAAALGREARADQRRHALTVLTRMAQHRPEMMQILVDALKQHFRACGPVVLEVGIETGEPLLDAATTALAALPEAEQRAVAGGLATMLPMDSVRLGPLCVRVVEIRASAAAQVFERKRTAPAALDLAQALHVLASRLDDIGDDAAAERELRRAASTLKTAGTSENARLVGARVASRLGSILRQQGRPTEALPEGEAAVRLAEDLARKHPSANETLLVALDGLGSIYGEIGRHEDALRTVSRARQLCEQRPGSDLVRRQLAGILSNESIHLGTLGRLEEATEVNARAVSIIESLSAENPDAGEPALARFLFNSSSALAELGRWQESLQQIRRSSLIFQRLAELRPSQFDQNLCESLEAESNRLSMMGESVEAHRKAHSALDIAERLHRLDQARHSVLLARCLRSESSRLAVLCRDDEALRSAELALEIGERLETGPRERLSSDFALTLRVLGDRLRDAGQFDRALEAYERSKSMEARFATSGSRARAEFLAELSNDIALCMRSLARPTEALIYADAGHESYARLASEHSARNGDDLAASLVTRALVLRDLGRHSDSQSAALEAKALFEQLFLGRPQAMAPSFGIALTMLAGSQAATGDLQGAVASLRHAAELVAPPAAQWGGEWIKYETSAACHSRLFQWLSGGAPSSVRVEEHLVARMRPHEVPPVIGLARLLSGCLAHDQDKNRAAESMRQLVDLAESAATSQRVELADAIVIATRYLATPDAQNVLDAYLAQRDGHPPRWLTDTLIRLGVPLP